MAGFANGGVFMALDSFQRQVIGRLAEIERHDAEICMGCGGEDCVCCEIYQDRKRWVDPVDLFEDRY